MEHIAFGIKFLFDHHVLRKHTPLICGLTITDRCNLDCRHCRVANRGKPDLSFQEAVEALDAFYREGGRTVYIQGGEPFIWRDGKYRLEDVVDYSQNRGFYTTIIYTNGTVPIDTSANTVFISIDGLEKTHDFLRGTTFNRIMKNINASTHISMYINFTINNYNRNEIEEFCKFVDTADQIRGVFFYLHTPYYGHDELYIAPGERHKILADLLRFRKTYKILNSRAGLKSALKNNWSRPLDICRVYENGNTFKCCRYPDDKNLCRECGYLSYAEIDQTLKLRPSAIANALKYF